METQKIMRHGNGTVVLPEVERTVATASKMEDNDFETEESLSEVFKAATKYVRQVGAKFDADKLLYFYARYKQVRYSDVLLVFVKVTESDATESLLTVLTVQSLLIVTITKCVRCVVQCSSYSSYSLFQGFSLSTVD
jgi:hypothetical protein